MMTETVNVAPACTPLMQINCLVGLHKTPAAAMALCSCAAFQTFTASMSCSVVGEAGPPGKKTHTVMNGCANYTYTNSIQFMVVQKYLQQQRAHEEMVLLPLLQLEHVE